MFGKTIIIMRCARDEPPSQYGPLRILLSVQARCSICNSMLCTQYVLRDTNQSTQRRKSLLQLPPSSAFLRISSPQPTNTCTYTHTRPTHTPHPLPFLRLSRASPRRCCCAAALRGRRRADATAAGPVRLGWCVCVCEPSCHAPCAMWEMGTGCADQPAVVVGLMQCAAFRLQRGGAGRAGPIGRWPFRFGSSRPRRGGCGDCGSIDLVGCA